MGNYIRHLACTLLLGAIVFSAVVSKNAMAEADMGGAPILYEGRLLDSSRQAVTAEQSFRFSFWSSSDFVSTDLINGEINTASSHFSGWQEEQAITPKSNGTFSIQLGKITPLPMFDPSTQMYLQIEVKSSGAPKTSYQLLDPTADNGADDTDRKIIGSVPYANVSGSSTSAEKTSERQFILDANDTVATAGSGTIRLQFGNSLAKFLEYDFANGYFFFNDDVYIAGDLTVEGLVNGVDFDNLQTILHGQNTDTGTSSTSFLINLAGNSLLLSTAGLTAPRVITFDDADTQVVGTDNVQTLTNKTIDGDVNTISNIDIASLKDRQKTLLLVPQSNTISIKEDGTNNFISLNQGYDETENQQYYSLTSQEPTLQDIDLYISFAIPDDFVEWQAVPIRAKIKTSSLDTADNQLDFSMEDSQKNPVLLIGGNDLVSTGTIDTWKEYNISLSGTPIFTPGAEALLKVKLLSRSGQRAIIGHIRLDYIGK